jgi:DNA-binding response OmpR family regulator
MDAFSETSIVIAVADAREADYIELLRLATRRRWSVHLMPSGRDAVRAAEYLPANLWIINADLPDMNGLDVVELLLSYVSPSDIFVIVDRYREEDEIRALALGVALFLCKPLEAAWLGQWSPRHSKSLN